METNPDRHLSGLSNLKGLVGHEEKSTRKHSFNKITGSDFRTAARHFLVFSARFSIEKSLSVSNLGRFGP